MRLLVVNAFFDPFSFGGATIIAEEMAARLFRDHGFTVFAASIRQGFLPCNSVVRHTTRFGFDAFNIGVSNDYTYERSYRNEELKQEFEKVIAFTQPDVVHIHCVQNIGAAFFDTLAAHGIPFLVTVHDHWWNCDRQFMIDTAGEYCGQRPVNAKECVRRCGGSLTNIMGRLDYLTRQLNKAQMIITPSEYMRSFLVDCGFDPAKLHVNKNGVTPPASSLQGSATIKDKIVFGYVGGPGHLKGWNLIVEAFRALDADSLEKCEIHAVDAGALVGASWQNDLLATSKGLPVKVIPPYNQTSIDQVFSSFTALLMPSNWKESFGLTAREALLRDVWVIASDAGGLAEDIVDGENGKRLLFPPNVIELRSAIVDVLNNAPFGTLPHKNTITTLDQQATELMQIISQLELQGREL